MTYFRSLVLAFLAFWSIALTLVIWSLPPLPMPSPKDPFVEHIPRVGIQLPLLGTDGKTPLPVRNEDGTWPSEEEINDWVRRGVLWGDVEEWRRTGILPPKR